MNANKASVAVRQLDTLAMRAQKAFIRRNGLLRCFVSQLVAQQIYDQGGSVTGSFGVAICRAGDSAEALVGRADDALYRAKRHGRKRVEAESMWASVER